MKITVLGSGTILSMPKRKPSSFLIENDNHVALMDMGPGILHQLAVLNINFLKPDTIFLTHFHLDHCSDVFSFLMSRYLLDNKSNSRLQVHGPVGLRHWYDMSASLQGRWLSESKPEIIEIKNDEINWANYRIRTYPTGHTEQSIAYRFEGKKIVFFSGDTGFNEDLVTFAKSADLGILECSHPNEKPVAGHLTPQEAGLFAQLANFNELAVCHMYPPNDVPDLKNRIAEKYNGSIIILEDSMII
jgi:ribonuclease BN (tRNA processing enzyme)